MYVYGMDPSSSWVQTVCQVAHPYILLSWWSLAIRDLQSLQPHFTHWQLSVLSHSWIHTLWMPPKTGFRKSVLSSRCLVHKLLHIYIMQASVWQLVQPMALLVADIQILWSRSCLAWSSWSLQPFLLTYLVGVIHGPWACSLITLRIAKSGCLLALITLLGFFHLHHSSAPLPSCTLWSKYQGMNYLS